MDIFDLLQYTMYTKMSKKISALQYNLHIYTAEGATQEQKNQIHVADLHLRKRTAELQCS